jgi:hypothetical protein
MALLSYLAIQPLTVFCMMVAAFLSLRTLYSCLALFVRQI